MSGARTRERICSVLLTVLLVTSLSVGFVSFGESPIQKVMAATTTTSEDFEGYSVGTTAPGDWDGGSIVSNSTMGTRSIQTTGGTEIIQTTTSADLSDVDFSGVIQPESGWVTLGYDGVGDGWIHVTLKESGAGTPEFRLRVYNGTTTLTESSSPGLPADTWFHLNITGDGQTYTATLDEIGGTFSASHTVTTSDMGATGQTLAMDTSGTGWDMTLDEYSLSGMSSSVSGTVTNESGSSISGATVDIEDGAGTVIETHTTDANGQWGTSLGDGDYTAVVSASGYNTASTPFSVAGSAITVDTTLSKTAHSVSGHVLDGDGNTVGNANVTISDGTGVVTSTQANSAGAWSVSLTNDTYSAEASAPAYLNGSITLDVAGPLTGQNITLSQHTVSGRVVDGSGTGVGNATVEVWAVSDSLEIPAGSSLKEEQEKLLRQASDPIPESFEANQDLAQISKDTDGTQVLVHPRSAWYEEVEVEGYQTGIGSIGGDLSTPLTQLDPGEPYVFSCWDLTRGDGLTEDAVNSKWKGKTTDCGISVERIGPDGSTVSTTNLNTSAQYSTLWAPGVTRNEHHGVEAAIQEGIYRISSEDGTLTTYVVVGDGLSSVARTYEQDLRDEAGQLSKRATELANLREQQTFTKITVEADSRGNWSADIPAGYSMVDAVAYKGTYRGEGLLSGMDPANRDLNSLRMEWRGKLKTQLEQDPSLEAADLGSLYLSTQPTRVEPPQSDVTVRVTEVSAPTYADNTQYQDWLARLNELVASESYAELQSFLTESMAEYDSAKIRSLAVSMLGVVEQNEQLDERTRELLEQNSRTDADYEQLKERLENQEATREELLELYQAQQQAVSEQQSTIESLRDTIQDIQEPTADGEPSLLNLKVPFRGSLEEEGTTVMVHLSNGTSHQMSSDYWSIKSTATEDATGSATHDYVVIEDYPLDPGTAVANIQVLTAGEDGLGKRKIPVQNPAYDGEVPSVESFNFNSLRPSAGTEVSMVVSPSEESTYTGIKNATVYNTQTGQQVPATVSGSEVTFTPEAAGSHLIKVELQSSSGQPVVESLRLKVGSTDLPMPPSVRVQSGVTGTYALTGDGVDRASIKRSGGELTVGAVFSKESSAQQLHVFTGDALSGSEGGVNVRVLEGAEQQSGRRMEVVVHTAQLQEGAHLYRGSQPLTAGEGSQAGKIVRNADSTLIYSYTNPDGSLSLSYKNNPGLVDRILWQVRTRLPGLTFGLTLPAGIIPQLPMGALHTSSTDIQIHLPEVSLPELGGAAAEHVYPGVRA